jgi:lipopolysaccharide heptosyltransferase II
MRILIIKPSSLGDVIHALPTAARLKRSFPDAKISWLINDSLAPILENCPVIDEIMLFRRKKWAKLQNFGEFFAFLRALRARKFDVALDLQGLFRSGFITFCSGALRKIGLSNAREGSRMFYREVVSVDEKREHLVFRYLAAANFLGAKQDLPVEFPIATFPHAQNRMEKLLDERGISREKPIVALHPGARWPTKKWFPDRFSALADEIFLKFGAQIIIVGTPDESDLADSIVKNAKKSRPISLAGATDLQMLVEFLRKVRVLVSHDTGPMHIASAIGTPCVAIFGASDPVASGPFAQKNVPHAVLFAGIHCSPCFSVRCLNPNHMECMLKIGVDEAVAAVQKIIRRQAR